MQRTSVALSLLAMFGCGGDDGGPGGPDAAVDLTPRVAVPGTRCAPEERVGLVEITEGNRVRANMFDRTDPMVGAPELSDAACGFHRYRPSQPCDPCPDGELCALDGRCTAAPRRATDGRLALRAGDQEQVFEADPELGTLGGDISLPGGSYAVEVFAFGQTVTLEAETAVPEPLAGFSASLLGSYDAPEGIEASWDPLPEGSHLFTRIPINHHAAGATFTECAVDASAGSLSVSQPMLEPLAVSTGLEFQSFEHIRFAAAETSRGCVEFRFTLRQTIGLE